MARPYFWPQPTKRDPGDIVQPVISVATEVSFRERDGVQTSISLYCLRLKCGHTVKKPRRTPTPPDRMVCTQCRTLKEQAAGPNEATIAEMGRQRVIIILQDQADAAATALAQAIEGALNQAPGYSVRTQMRGEFEDEVTPAEIPNTPAPMVIRIG